MNASDREIQEWIVLGKNALKRIAPTTKPSCSAKKLRIVSRQTSISGQIIEYDTVVAY